MNLEADPSEANQSAGSERRFAYVVRVAGDDGVKLEGTLTATGADAARAALESAGLAVLALDQGGDAASDTAARVRGRRLGALDFAAFNRQLAQLTEAGMPVASGLRLIAADVRRGRLSRSIEAVADELEGGADLSEAFERHRGAFPPLYAQLVEVGVKTGRLPGVLLNLGRHLSRVSRLRIALWRALAYPLVVLVMLVGVMVIWAGWVAPQFGEIFEDFGTQMPALTLWVLTASGWMLPMACVILGLLVAVPVLWKLMDRFWVAVGERERLLMRLPLLGPALKRGAVARWCGLLRLGVDAGMDLPGALRMAGSASASRAVDEDADVIAHAIERGEELKAVNGDRLRVVPGAVPASMHLATTHADLPGVLENLEAMYGQQAELRLGTLQAVIAPVLLVLLALALGLMTMAMFLPLVKLMSSLM
ncbi:MAG: type II secretion system F family protein [Planctomycetota bacterium]